ncbi:MFS transporter [Nocardia sp. NPDC050175]|uniref:MFS transporter n=1 Tax=Nocardia sp. NPDC050175 TaxID=3364317 RepID=UPI0037897DFA
MTESMPPDTAAAAATAPIADPANMITAADAATTRPVATGSHNVALGRLLTMVFPATTAMYALFNGVSSVVLPAQVEAMDPASKVGNLALVTTIAAIASMIAIPTGGSVSDRTRSRFGRRAPWIALSAIVSGVLAGCMGLASNLVGLLVAAFALWFALNFYQGAITAMLPDRVPVERRGLASAVIGLGTPVGIVVGVNLASRVSQFAAYAVFGVAVVATTTVFLLGAREPSSLEMASVSKQRRSLSEALRYFLAAFGHRDFRLAFFSRFGLFAAYFTVNGYLYYILQDYIGTANIPGGDAAAAVSTLLTVTIIAWIVVASIVGSLADRFDRRKLFVGISALGLAASMTIPVISPTWTGMLIFSGSIGAAIGTYVAIDLAVMSLVLPHADSAGRDLGILQVATGLPQLLSAAVASAIITWLGGYVTLYAFGAVCAVVSGILMLRIRSVR